MLGGFAVSRGGFLPEPLTRIILGFLTIALLAWISSFLAWQDTYAKNASTRWPKLLVQVVKHRSDGVNDQSSLRRTDNALVGVSDAAVVTQGIDGIENGCEGGQNFPYITIVIPE